MKNQIRPAASPAQGKLADRYLEADADDLYLLDPGLFQNLFDAGSIDAVRSGSALPKILGLIQLRRTMGQFMNLGLNASIVIGDQTPVA